MIRLVLQGSLRLVGTALATALTSSHRKRIESQDVEPDFGGLSAPVVVAAEALLISAQGLEDGEIQPTMMSIFTLYLAMVHSRLNENL